MPELPEVETIVRGLRTHFLAHRIQSIQMTGRPLFEERPDRFCGILVGREIHSITRHGKAIFFSLGPSQGSPPVFLRVHLGMTGQMLIKYPSDPLESHTHLVFQFENYNRELRYRDIRRFGEMKIFESLPTPTVPDAWECPPDQLASSLKNIKGFLKHGLLSQKIVAGLGNIYVDEALHKAKLHPRRCGDQLRDSHWRALAGCIRKVLGDSIQLGGTSFQNYVDVNGSRGDYKGRLSVYGKAGQPCVCGTRIKKMIVAGRGTHFCPRCQPSPR